MAEQKVTASPAIPGLTLRAHVALQVLAARVGVESNPEDIAEPRVIMWAFRVADLFLTQMQEDETKKNRSSLEKMTKD